MLPTEVQRILLLIGLAATAYLMILAWNDDYVRQQQPVEISAEPEVDAPLTGGAGDDAPDLPRDAPEVAGAPAGTPAGSPVGTPDSDVPDPSMLTADPVDEVSAAAAAPAAQGRLVRVTTDTLDVWIDRLGGDIVRVQLPQHRLEAHEEGEGRSAGTAEHVAGLQ